MRKLIFALGFLAIGFTVSAQQKIGYINSLELLSLMPEVKKADAQLETYAKTFKDQLDVMQKDYDGKVKAFQAGEKTMGDAIKEVKYKEIQDLQKRMIDLSDNAEQKVGDKKEELYKPIFEKANTAIQAVGKEKGYAYILDSSTGALLFAVDSDNVLGLVKAKLGIQ